ncbi:hypothetical protein NQF87_07975 [Bombella sp. TMW 2.2559]|uniref:Baseplate assembly protein n=1 Tax=Bombella dulcis TaxID=2967339 RepID=A0ABT3WGL1_9PROT|nr:hypothetical protein [Bombella dulcis]MCX5616904.1 hypothetical protein [Bombella dulcis]
MNGTRIETNCDITTPGEVRAGAVSLKQHVHGGVQAGAGTTSPPQ